MSSVGITERVHFPDVPSTNAVSVTVKLPGAKPWHTVRLKPWMRHEGFTFWGKVLTPNEVTIWVLHHERSTRKLPPLHIDISASDI